MNSKLKQWALASSIGLLSLGASTAQAESYDQLAHTAESYSGSDSSHHGGHHVVGLFLGGTTTDESTEFSVGVEYEYHFNQYFGIGVIGEHTIESPHFTDGSTVALAAFYAHPWRGLRITTAVGAEVGHGDLAHHDTGHVQLDSHGHAIHAEPEEAGAEVLVRLGFAYDFKITNEVAIAPAVNIDFVDGEENVVYGMVFSYHF